MLELDFKNVTLNVIQGFVESSDINILAWQKCWNNGKVA